MFLGNAALFEAVADRPWAVFLDSGLHHPGRARYDIIAAEPYVRLVTRGALTEVHADGVELSRADPFELLRTHVAMDAAGAGDLPFSGGAIGYFGYDLARRIERLPARARDAERIPDMAVGLYDWAVVVDHSERRAWLAGEVVLGYSWPRFELEEQREGSLTVGLGLEILVGGWK